MSELSALQAMNGMGAISNVGSTIAQNNALGAQTRANLGWMDIQRQDVLRRGQIAGSRAQLNANQLAGRQAAAAAASGVDVNTGSAAQVRSDTQLFAEVDRLNIENSAYRQAMGISAEQANLLSATRNKQKNSLLQMGNTLGMAGVRAAYYDDKYKGLGKGFGDNQNDLPNIPHP